MTSGPSNHLSLLFISSSAVTYALWKEAAAAPTPVTPAVLLVRWLLPPGAGGVQLPYRFRKNLSHRHLMSLCIGAPGFQLSTLFLFLKKERVLLLILILNI